MAADDLAETTRALLMALGVAHLQRTCPICDGWRGSHAAACEVLAARRALRMVDATHPRLLVEVLTEEACDDE